MYYVYIMSSYSRVLYIGVTSSLERRVEQHRLGVDPNAFTTRYRIHQLVYYEEYTEIRDAIDRETQLKAYRRAKKIELIDTFNPQWVDLALPTAQIPRRLRGSE